MSARFAVFVLALSVGALAQVRRGDVAFTTHDLSRSQIATYPVTLNAGDFLRVDVTGNDVDVTVGLADPAGRTALSIDTSADDPFARTLVAVVERPGIHTVTVRGGTSAHASGHYSIRIAPAHPATGADRRLVDAERAYADGLRLLDRTRAAGWPDALSSFQQAQRAFADAGDRRGEMKSTYAIAHAELLLHRAGNLQTARDAERMARDLGDRAAIAGVLPLIGDIVMYEGNAAAALAPFEEAIAITRELGQRTAEMKVLNEAALAYYRLGDGEHAADMLKRALGVARETHDTATESSLLNNLGVTYKQLGDTDAALEWYRQALANRRAAADPRGEMIAFNNIGNIEDDAGRFADALQNHRRAVALARTMGASELLAESLTSLGHTELLLGDAENALQHERAALALRKSIDDGSGEAEALEAIGETLRQLRHLDDAAAALEQSLALRRKANEQYNEADSLFDLAQVERDRGNDARAIEYVSGATNLDERLRRKITSPDLRVAFRAHGQDAYELLIDLLERHGGGDAAAAALNVSERARARVLLESVVESRIDRPRYDALPTIEPLAAGDIQHHVLDEQTVLLEFALGRERSWLWAVTPTEIVTAELPSRDAIDAATRKVYRQLSSRGAAASADAAALSRMLLGGIADRLRTDWKGKRLAIVPSGSLGYVPFAALPAPDAVAGSPLVQGHELVIIPSASVMAALRDEAARRPPARKDIAVVADPVFGTALPRLTFSRAEADAIAESAPANAVTRSVGLDATRAAVLGGALNDYRIVHLATHGIVDSEHPAMSALVLSLVDKHGAAQDGYLRQRDIYGLRLNADLVVLSACQTALGKEVRGEGLMALTRAFMYAGTPRVIASLWEVGDRATAEFMRIFYQHLLREHMRPAAALRAAQLAMARNPRWSAPYYWGGFVLHGDWQ